MTNHDKARAAKGLGTLQASRMEMPAHCSPANSLQQSLRHSSRSVFSRYSRSFFFLSFFFLACLEALRGVSQLEANWRYNNGVVLASRTKTILPPPMRQSGIDRRKGRVMISESPSLMCFFNRSNIERTISSKILFYVCASMFCFIFVSDIIL